jgi:hypothetical protein
MKLTKKYLIVFFILFSLIAVKVFIENQKGSTSKEPISPLAYLLTNMESILHDNGIYDYKIEPQVTLYVMGKCPNCTIIRQDAIIHIKNSTYLAIFNITAHSVELIPTNEEIISKYLSFFEAHGGKIVNSTECITTTLLNKTTTTCIKSHGIFPAIVYVNKTKQ